MGRQQPIVTVCDFYSLATCYADANGKYRPEALVAKRRDKMIYI